MNLEAFIVGFVLLGAVPAYSQIPPLIRYQGTLVDANNVPIEGSHMLTFRLYPAATGGSATWTEAQTGVPISRGVFNVLLGQVVPLTVAFEKEYWLSVQVDSDGEMSPRQQLTSVPYAVRAKVAEALDTSSRFQVDNGGALASGLVAYWNMQEAAGTRKDSKGANALTDYNTVTQAAGKAGQAAQFTSANSEYLSIADNADLSTGNVNFTISTWVYLASDPANDMTIVSKNDEASASNREYLLTWRDDDRFVFVIYGPDGALSYVVANAFGAPGTATWHFVVAWHDADTNTINIQVNNGAVSSSAANANGPADTAASFRIGAERSTPVYFWDGRIDEVGLWKRVLTPQERADLYNGGNGNTYGPPASANPGATTVIEQPQGFAPDSGGALGQSLIAYWGLVETSGTRQDSKGSNALTDNNTVTQAAGKVGQAGKFVSANGEYLSIADNADLSVGDIDFTIAAWVYLDC